MKIGKRTALCICIMVAMAGLSQAKGWRDIVPLHSTREDVKRLLGSTDTPEERLYDLYDLANEVAYITYSSDPCKRGTYSGWNVPRGTVIDINVAPKTELRVADLQLEGRRYKKKADHHVIGVIYYTDREEGITIEAAGEKVMKIYYYPAAKDDHLRCPDNPRPAPTEAGATTQSHDKIDSYGDIPFDKEKERLDHLALQLQGMPDMRGYIIVYAGRRAHAGEAQVRAERAKKYLVSVRGIEAGQIVTIDGGHQEELTVDLYLVPRGAPAPTATSTVDPSEVQIIKAGSAKNNNRR